MLRGTVEAAAGKSILLLLLLPGWAPAQTDPIRLETQIRFERGVDLERIDEGYLDLLIRWQLDQARVRVASPGASEAPVLSLEIVVKRLIGPAQLLEENRRIEGLYGIFIDLIFFRRPSPGPGSESAPRNVGFHRSYQGHASDRQETQRLLVFHTEQLMGEFLRRQN